MKYASQEHREAPGQKWHEDPAAAPGRAKNSPHLK
jgi:hypothetical protein